MMPGVKRLICWTLASGLVGAMSVSLWIAAHIFTGPDDIFDVALT